MSKTITIDGKAISFEVRQTISDHLVIKHEG